MRNVKELVWDYGIVIIGNFLLAAGVVLFILPNDVLTGGVAGIAVALFPIFHIPTDLMINALTIALFVLGALTLGKQFAIKTLLSTICYPVFISVLSSSVHAIEITDNQLLASIYGGVLMGADEGSVVVQVPAGTSLPSVSKTDPGTGSGFVLPVSLGGTGRNTPEGVRQLFNIYVGDSEPPAGLPVGSVYLRRRGM